MASVRSSSNPIAPGRTAKSNASTALCKPSGPTGTSSPATTNASQHLRPGSSTTTMNDATGHSEAILPSADCDQRPDRVHLGVMSRQVVLDSADGWGPDCGVVPVMIVEVQPAW